MSGNLRQIILEALAQGPRFASEIYRSLGARGHARGNCRTTVARMIEQRQIFRATLRLEHNDSILSRTPDFRSVEVLKTLFNTGFGSRPGLVDLVECLRSTHPVISRADVAKITATRIGRANEPEWEPIQHLLEGLEELGLLSRDNSQPEPLWVANEDLFREAGRPHVALHPNVRQYILRERVRLKVAQAVAQWTWQSNFVTEKGTQYPSPESPVAVVTYANHAFDYLGFSFVQGIGVPDRGQPKGRPFVGDVLLDVCGEHYAEGFARRVRNVTSIADPVPVGFILAKGFEGRAFATLKNANLLPWSSDRLLGKATADAIQSILVLTQQIVNERDVNPKIFFEAFEGVNSFGALFGNLKGVLFEMMIAYLFQARGFTTRLGWQVSDSDGTFDVDVVATSGTGQAFILECKGMAKDLPVDSGEVAKHFQRRTPCARRALLSGQRVFNFKHYTSILVTSGCFDEEGERIFARAQASATADLSVELWDRNRLMAELDGDNKTELKDLVDRFF